LPLGSFPPKRFVFLCDEVKNPSLVTFLDVQSCPKDRIFRHEFFSTIEHPKLQNFYFRLYLALLAMYIEPLPINISNFKRKCLFFGQMSRFFIIILLYIFSSKGLSQGNSFQVVLDSAGYRMKDIVVNEDEEIIIFMKKFPDNNTLGLYLLPIEESGGNVQGLEISIPSNYIIDSEYHKDRVVFIAYGVSYPIPNTSTYSSKSIIFNIDLTSNSKWAKYLNGQIRQNKFSIDKNGEIIIANTPWDIYFDDYYNEHTSVLELFKLDEAGNNVWKKGIRLLDSLSSEFPYVQIKDIALDEYSNIYILGMCGDVFSTDEKWFPYILKFDSTGHPLLLKTLIDVGQDFNEIEVTSSGVMLLNHAPNNPDLYNSGIYHDKYAKLIKLDFDLNFLWGKKYSGENFPYYSAGIKEKPNGHLLMTHATFGAYPVVLTELDANGNVLSEKGYPNYQPQVAPFSDGSFLITSVFNYNDAGETFYQPVIARTDTNGEIEGCENYPACITAEDYTLEFGTFNYDTVSIPDLEGFDTLVQPVNFSFSEFCGFPPAPLPDFDFPDSLCIGGFGMTSNTRNQLANAREWHLTGPGVDSLLRDSFDFSYQFGQPGEYILGQAVWVLGCRYDYERKVTVLPPLSVAILDSIICPGEPLEVVAEANRPSGLIWAGGQTGSVLPINISGTYAVTATDGHCKASNTANVNIVAELLGATPPLTLPPDTTDCQPYLLLPQSQFTELFYTNTDPTPTASFLLEVAGTYQIGMTALGCEFWEDYEYDVDCHVDIYYPNSFSPNGDGINDVFQPFGNDFEVLELAVFDRWGGLLHRGLDWDGGKAGQGIYSYKLSYTNLKSGLREEVNGEVLLVK
jgi:gliding motility-associated-like protein